VQAAIYAYNHSVAYVNLVLARAARYTAGGTPVLDAAVSPACQAATTAPLPPGAAGKILAYALARLGKPYQFSWDPRGQIMIGSYVCPAQSAVAGRSGSATGVVHAGLDLAQRCVAASVILYAAEQLGKPYLWGATGPDAFDCSGLTMMAYRAVGVYIPRTSQQQWLFGPRVAASAVEPGDLVFFAGSDGTMTAPGHVGIVMGNGLMIAAPFTGANVRIETYAGAYDLVGFTRPSAGS
jgi:cell wall-associated NlpC family hydrolase